MKEFNLSLLRGAYIQPFDKIDKNLLERLIAPTSQIDKLNKINSKQWNFAL